MKELDPNSSSVSIVLSTARDLFSKDRDPGVHSAAELLIRRLGARPPALNDSARTVEIPAEDNGRSWYVGPNDHTFAVWRGPFVFLMGAPFSEERREDSEKPHYRRIERTIALATCETTYGQIIKFNPKYRQDSFYGSTEPDSPANCVAWFQAAAYCNWLSEKAGLEKCYQEPIGPGMVVDKSSLDRDGYRLPTEAELELACRVGTVTSRPFGDTEELIDRYVWTWRNSDGRSHKVGMLLPNELGLFDVLGNMWERCHEGPTAGGSYTPYPDAPTPETAILDVLTDVLKINNDSIRMAKGGAYDYSPSFARSAKRYDTSADLTHSYMGFRVARTIKGN